MNSIYKYANKKTVEINVFDTLKLCISEKDWKYLCKYRFLNDSPSAEDIEAEFVSGTGITVNRKELWPYASDRFTEYIHELRDILFGDYVYFARMSFCMADDVIAPNIRRYDYNASIGLTIFDYIKDYFQNIPKYCWNGYCDGELIVKVKFREDAEASNEDIRFLEGWEEALRRNKVIYFDQDEDNSEFGITHSRYYSLDKAAEVFKEYYGK